MRRHPRRSQGRTTRSDRGRGLGGDQDRSLTGNTLRFRSLLLLFIGGTALTVDPLVAWSWQVTVRSPEGPKQSRAEIAVDPVGDVLATIPVPIDHTALVKLSRRTGAEVWRTHLDYANEDPLLLDSAGDLFLGGVKFSGKTGKRLWKYNAHELAVDAGGDVIGASWIPLDPTPPNFRDFVNTIVKLSGQTGGEVWRYPFDDWPTTYAAAVTEAGDVVAMRGGVDASSVVVVKLAGVDGRELWRRDIDNVWRAFGMAVDASGGVVVAAGFVPTPMVETGLDVVKLSPDGNVLFRASVSRSNFLWEEAFSVAVDAAGDVVAVGVTQTEETGLDVTVAKFASDTGAERWRRVIDGTLHANDFPARQLIVVEGDVLIGGTLLNVGTCEDLAIVKISGSTGEILWQQEIDGTSSNDYCLFECDADLCIPERDRDAAYGMAVDGSGRVIAIGSIWNLRDGDPQDEPTAIRFSDRLTGRSLRIASGAEGQRLALASSDVNILAPARKSLGDPSRTGAVLEVKDEAAGALLSFDLPASGWKGRRTASGVPRYDFRARSGSCTRAVVESGKSLKVRCERVDLPRRAGPRSIAARLRLGSGPQYCVRFGGKVRLDTPTMYEAHGAPPPTSCP